MPLRAAFLLVILLLARPGAAVELLIGTPARVFDGDSFILEEAGALRHEVRIAGIDAPEKGQPWSRVARERLATLLAGRAVLVEAYKRDRYGRLVARVSVDGEDVALAQLRAGLAWHDVHHLAEQTEAEAGLYGAAQEEARAARRGLWQGRPVPPWEWRRANPR